MNEPMVSVVVAAFNQAEHLPGALRSLREQTLPSSRLQVIAVNDGSADGTSEILRRWAEARGGASSSAGRSAGWIERIERENRGLPASCNEGLERARGLYFARLDSDDFAEPAWLETLVRALEADPQAVCAVPDRWEGDLSAWRQVQPQVENLYSLIACGTLFRTEDLRAVGGFRPLYWEEYDLYLRLRSRGRFLRVKRPLYRYRKHAGGMTSDDEKRRRGWEELAEVWGLETLRAAGQSRELEQAIGAKGVAG